MRSSEHHLSQYLQTKAARHTLTGAVVDGQVVFPPQPQVAIRTPERYNQDPDLMAAPEDQAEVAKVAAQILLFSAAMD